MQYTHFHSNLDLKGEEKARKRAGLLCHKLGYVMIVGPMMIINDGTGVAGFLVSSWLVEG